MAENEKSGSGTANLVRFGVFQVDLRSGELRKRGVRIGLQQQPFHVLRLLLERPGQVVLREEIRVQLWPSDTYVDFDHGLNKAVNKLREALGDAAASPRFIETLPKRGYRFIAPVEPVHQDRPVPATIEPASVAIAVPAPAAATGHASASPSSRRLGFSRRQLLYGGLLCGIVAAAGIASWVRRSNAPPPDHRTMLAVLPFANIQGDAEEEYFSDGMTDEMILQLSRLRPEHLGVIARTSAMHYKGSRLRVDQIARELGVQYVLEGTVRRSGRSVRITAQLVQPSDQTPLWAESFERDVENVFEIQSDVARRIASSLAIELLPSTATAGVPRATAEAYEAYLKARYYWNRRTPVDLERALTLLEEAIAKDPSYVPAQAALADALNVLPWYGLRQPREAYPRSKDVARGALALDDASAAAHTALAYAHHYYDWNWVDAEREYARALQLNPNYAQAHQWLAAHYAEMGRTEDALVEIHRAQKLDPHALIISAAIGWIQYLGRRFDPAIAQLQHTLEINPEFVPARLWLGQALEATGRPMEAIAQYQSVRQIAGVAPTGLGELARGYAVAGRTSEARAALAELLDTARTRYVEADLFARVYAAVGNADEAFTWLDRGFEERAVKMVLLAVDPQFDLLRQDPRFPELLRRLNLPE